METIEVLKSYVEELKNNSIDMIKRRMSDSLSDVSEKLKLEIEEKGYALVPDFLTSQECGQIREVIDDVIENNPKIWKDAIGSDNRIFFSNLASPLIDAFFHNKFIVDILSTYERTPNYTGFTLANKVMFKDNNAGSGGGWHRDFVKRKQTKALVYLTDVSERTGAFQFLTGTHKFQSIIEHQKEFNFKYNQSRFTNEEIEALLKVHPELLYTVTGKAGSLILVDTRGIHRGKPIEEGMRYALTNYYWFNASIPKHIAKLNPFT